MLVVRTFRRISERAAKSQMFDLTGMSQQDGKTRHPAWKWKCNDGRLLPVACTSPPVRCTGKNICTK